MNAILAVAVLVTAQIPGLNKLTPQDQKGLSTMQAHSEQFTALSQLAQTNASSPHVKTLGAIVTTDNVVIQKLLNAVAALRGVNMPSGDKSDKLSEAIADLKGKKGPEFDRGYAHALKDALDDEIDDVEAQGQATEDAAVEAVMAKMLALLEKQKAASEKVLKLVEPNRI
jgi:hypothetical protein